MFKLTDGTDGDAQARWEEFRAALAVLPGPVHVPDRSAYDFEVERRLASDPRCRENWDRYKASSRRSATVDYLPVRLDIENVSRCNFQCAMCQVSGWDKHKRAEDISPDFFQRLIDEQYGLVEIKLHGMGEPTLAGDDFYQMIAYARARNIWVRTVTNASTFHQKDAYRKLVDSGINEIQISIHSANRKGFEAITGRDRLELVARNCALINGYCDEKGIMRTKMWTVVQRENQDELPELVDLAARVGFKTQVFALDLNDWGQDRWLETNRQRAVGMDFDIDLAHHLVERGKAQGVRVAFWLSSTVYDTNRPEKRCPWPFEWAYVSSDQRIVPCCMLANPDYFEIGTRTESLSETWLSDAYVRFRQAHLDGDIPSVCQGCYVDEANKGAKDAKRVAATGA